MLSSFTFALRAAALCFLCLAALPASAHDYTLGALKIGHPWSRATPGSSASVGAGYLTIANTGESADTLVSVTADFSDAPELHEMKMDGGVMTMRPLEGGIAIPPGETVTLAPGGMHIMFRGLTGPLVEGERRKATLVFEQAGNIEVEFAVEAVGARAPNAEAMENMDHSGMHHGE